MFGAIGNILGTLSSQMFASEQQEDAQQWAGGEAAQNRAFQERMRATQYQTAVQDLSAAGLNPMLAYHQGGAGTPAGGTVGAGLASPSGHPDIAASLQSAAQIDLLAAQAKKTEAEEQEIKARTPTHEVTREHLKQQIGESAQRIEKIIVEIAHSQASALNIKQQTINLKEAVEQVRATVQNLRAHTQLYKEQTSETAQRVKQNLPELERILRNLERSRREMDQPAQAASAAAADSFIGQLGAYLRAINPLKGFLDSAR